MAAEGSVARGERNGAASQIIECQYPGPSRRLIQSRIGGASSSSATPGGRRSPTSISRRGRAAAKLLTRDEARRIAPNIAKLPPAINKTAPKIFDVTA